MRLLWKIVLPLVLVLPIVAYVAGTLASEDNGSDPRETIVIQDSGDQGSSDDRRRGGKKDDDDEEIRREGDDDADDVEVVEAEPDDVTRTRTGRDAGGDDGDDGNSGPGGDDGDDDRSGSGGDDTDRSRDD